MSAEIEEIIGDTDVAEVQDLLPDSNELKFKKISGRRRATARPRRPGHPGCLTDRWFDPAQRRAIYLSVGCPRQRVGEDEGRGNHVAWKLLSQVTLQLIGRQSRPIYGDNIGCQPLLARLAEIERGRFPNLVMLAQRCLDLSEFDSIPP